MCVFFFFYVLFSGPPRSIFFRLNQVRKRRKRCSHSRLNYLSGNNSRFSWPKCRLVLFVLFGCYGQPWLFWLSQAMTRGKRSVKWKRRQNSNRTRIIAGSPLSRPPPSYSKAKLGITHTESLFARLQYRECASKRSLRLNFPLKLKFSARVRQFFYKWYYDQKNHFLFSSDFESVFAKHPTGKIFSFVLYPKAVYFECKFWIARSAITHVQNWSIGHQRVGSRENDVIYSIA